MDKYTCNGCIHLVELFKHPSNANVFYGSIKDKTGLYACLALHKMERSGGILFDHKPGGCEMYNDGRPKFVVDEKRLKVLLNDYPSIEEQMEFVKDIEDIRQLKQYNVRNQKYANAAVLRDMEKKAIEREEAKKE